MNDDLKQWLISEQYAAADATEEQLKEAAKQAVKDGKLSVDELISGRKQADDDSPEGRLNKLGETIATKTATAVSDSLGSKFDELVNVLKGGQDTATGAAGDDTVTGGNGDEQRSTGPDQKTIDEMQRRSQESERLFDDAMRRNDLNPSGLTGQSLYAQAEKMGGDQVRVKKASERYDHTRTQMKHIKSRIGPMGQPVNPGDPFYWWENNTLRTADLPSQAEQMKSSVWLKYMVMRSPSVLQKLHGMGLPTPRFNEHEKQLLLETLHEDRFVGPVHAYEHPITARKLTDFDVKTVLDDGSSGGQEAVPEFFDMMIFATPLLHGELLPLVDVRPMPRGSSVESASIGTPTFVTTAEGTGVSEFSTSSFVSDYSLTIYPMSVGITFGRDFLEDAVPGFAQTVIDQIGQEYLRKLDENIAIGDGTNEPQGLANASGQSVSSENGTSGALTYNDALNLVHGIDKAHRNAFGGSATVYVMNDSQYKQFMQITTGVTGDTRPIFGMNLKDYMLGDYPVRVQNNISNGEIYFCNMRGYRLYRRQGLQFTTETSGSTLTLANEQLIFARARFGGKITLSTYLAQMTDASVS